MQLTALGTYETGLVDEGVAEISAYDPASKRLFVVNGFTKAIDVFDFTNPSNIVLIGEISVADYGDGVNSIAVKDGILAAAVENEDGNLPGEAVFFDTDGNYLSQVTVGVLPDMLTFTPDGSKVLVANEGEPTDEGDPEASISIIDLTGGVASLSQTDVQTADFQGFNGQEAALQAAGLRLFPDKSVAEDVEPEYIAVSPDGSQAFVTLQENNGVAVVDMAAAEITEIQPLGYKDWTQSALDASDKDGAINIQPWPVLGMYQPDAIASYSINNQTYYITANEGDDRGEDERIKDLVLDPVAFPNRAELQEDEALGRLAVSTVDGDIDGDGDYDQLYAYGGRSFSIWDSEGNQVFDSGDDIAQITARQTPEFFNANDGDPDEFDGRSDNKGAEPEGVTIGEVNGRTYAFIGLERSGGGVLVYDVSNPNSPEFVQYARTEGDIAPEGLTFIDAADSPTNRPLLVVTNEFSGTTTTYDFGENTIIGSNEIEALIGTELDELLQAQGGDDLAAGDLGDDVIFGGDGDDVLRGDLNLRDAQVGVVGGDDIIYGGNGNDRIGGKSGNDILYGDAGDDRIWGDDGDDILRGGLGDDILTGDDFSGGQGRDTFVLASGEGTDTIVDFETGVDFIGLADGLSFGQLTISQQGNHAEIFAGDEVLAIVKNTNADDLTATAFTTI